METEIIDGVEYPKGAWKQLEAAMICLGHVVELRLSGGYEAHRATCRICNTYSFSIGTHDRGYRGGIQFSSYRPPKPCSGEPKHD